MDGRLVRPQGAVEVERILADFAVVGHDPLGVDVLGIPLGPHGGAEVEGVPQPDPPQVIAVRKLPPVFLVEPGQELFRLGAARHVDRPAERIVGVHVGRGTRAIFAYRKRNAGMLAAQAVEMRAQLAGFPVIPSVIAVGTDRIDRLRHLGHIDHAPLFAAIGEHHGAGGIEFTRKPGQLVQQRHRVRHHLGRTAEKIGTPRPEVHFVGDAPDRNRGMVVVLVDEIKQLLAGVFDDPGGGFDLVPGVGPGRNQPDLVPQNDAIAVGQFVDGRAVLIV